MNILNIIDTIYESQWFPTALIISVIILVVLFIIVILLGVKDARKGKEPKRERLQDLKDVTFDTPSEKEAISEDVTFEIPVLTTNLENFKKSLEAEIEREEKVNVIKETSKEESKKQTKVLDKATIENTDVVPIISLDDKKEEPTKEKSEKPENKTKEEQLKHQKREILKEATYEIGELLGIFKQIELADKLTNDIIIKTGRRISEILESVELAKEYDQTPTKKQETTKKGTVYFLEKGTGKDRTFYEDDIGADNCNKGIGKKYYKDLLFQLEQIENRNHIRIPSIRPNNNKSYPYTAEFGVRLISSNRTSTYYIPVGNDDAIIVGVRFIDTGDDYRKTLEHRVKTHSRRLEELIEKVNSAENKKEAQKYIKEIKNILSQGEKNKGTDEELTTMFTVPKVEITPPKHI